MNALVNITATKVNSDSCSQPGWYAIQTRSRHEQLVSNHLHMRGITEYLPRVTEIHRWSDRRKRVDMPLFPGYVFVQFIASNERRFEILRAPGAVRFVGPCPGGTLIPDEQIESVRILINKNVPLASHPFLTPGQRVRVRGGALDQLQGTFVRRDGEDTLVISIDAMQKALAISIRGYDLEAV